MLSRRKAAGVPVAADVLGPKVLCPWPTIDYRLRPGGETTYRPCRGAEKCNHGDFVAYLFDDEYRRGWDILESIKGKKPASESAARSKDERFDFLGVHAHPCFALRTRGPIRDGRGQKNPLTPDDGRGMSLAREKPRPRPHPGPWPKGQGCARH